MKIAVVSNMYPDKKHPSYGVFVKNFCNILDDINVDYKLHVMSKADNSIEKLLRYIKFYIGTTIALLFEKVDIIYVHYASHSSLPVLWSYKIRKKRIFTNVHGSDVVPENTKQEKMQKYTKRILAISDKVIVPSEYFKKLVSQKYDINEDKIIISPSGGVNDKIFYKDREKDYRDFLQLGFVGRLIKGKGCDTLLRACAELKVPFRLTVVGSGSESSFLLKLSEELGISDSIEWINLLPQVELRRIYNAIDVFVFPSELKESLGLVAIEAMACGTPVIASDNAAQSYYIKDGENGYKFDKGDSKELTEKLHDFHRLDLSEKLQMCRNAKETSKSYLISEVTKGIKYILEIE